MLSNPKCWNLLPKASRYIICSKTLGRWCDVNMTAKRDVLPGQVDDFAKYGKGSVKETQVLQEILIEQNATASELSYQCDNVA
jgi:hypothetical protein